MVNLKENWGWSILDGLFSGYADGLEGSKLLSLFLSLHMLREWLEQGFLFVDFGDEVFHIERLVLVFPGEFALTALNKGVLIFSVSNVAMAFVFDILSGF